MHSVVKGRPFLRITFCNSISSFCFMPKSFVCYVTAIFKKDFFVWHTSFILQPIWPHAYDLNLTKIATFLLLQQLQEIIMRFQPGHTSAIEDYYALCMTL